MLPQCKTFFNKYLIAPKKNLTVVLKLKNPSYLGSNFGFSVAGNFV